MTAAVAASSSVCSRIYNSAFTLQSSIAIPSNFSQRPSTKPLNHGLKVHQLCIPSPPISLSCRRRTSAPSDAFQVAANGTSTRGLSDWEPVEGKTEGSKAGENPAGSSEDRKVFVGNLPYTVTSSQLAEIFEVAGTVESAEIIYDRLKRLSRGFGFVTMGSVQEAEEAIRKFDGTVVADRTLKVNFPEVPRGGERLVMRPKIMRDSLTFIDSPHKIYAGNLSWFVTSHSLRDAFANQPGVLSARVIYERDTGRSKGYGFVSFETAEAAEAALESMQSVEIEGRPLKLKVALNRSPPPLYGENSDKTLKESYRLFSSFSNGGNGVN